MVSEVVLATGEYQGQSTEVRAITGVSPSLIVALRAESGNCAPGRGTNFGAWALVTVAKSDSREMTRAMCAVLDPRNLGGTDCS